ncbi:MAG: hypothetical protein ACMUIG_02775 [Thermoplasmatota archaeon]
MKVIVSNPMDIIISLDNEEELTGPEIFALADALDAYEIQEGIEEKLVVDIVEISSAGVFAVHIIPKQMITYNEIMEHVDSMVSNAVKREDISCSEYFVKKVLFRTTEPGKPSETIGDIEEIKEKVDTLWKGFKDDMKSYA